METLYVAVGALSSIILFLLGYAVIGVVNGKKQAQTLENYIKSVEYRCESIERIIDHEVSEVQGRLDETYRELDSELDETRKVFQSSLDSRLDKLEHKLRETQVIS